MRDRRDSKLDQMGIIDRYYPGSPPGVVRCFQFLIGLCALIAIQNTGSCWYFFHTRFRIVTAITVSSFLLALTIYLLYLYRVDRWLGKYINLPITLFGIDVIVVFLFFMSSVLCFTSECPLSRSMAAAKLTGIFGLMGILGFSATAYMEHCWYKSSLSASEDSKEET